MQPALTRRNLVLGALALGFCAPFAATADAQTAPPEAVQLAGQHPAGYYRKAADLFRAGRRDDAVFLFYLGQLRYRVHLLARKGELKPDADPALFASLSEVVGRPLNEYAFGDIPVLARTINAVLDWDTANPDPFTPPARYRAAHENIRAGLVRMRAQVVQQADTLRAQRRANGLQNRN